jgi:hypothetical protein
MERPRLVVSDRTFGDLAPACCRRMVYLNGRDGQLEQKYTPVYVPGPYLNQLLIPNRTPPRTRTISFRMSI